MTVVGHGHGCGGGDVDPGRLGALGYSINGFMSSWMTGQTDRFMAAAVGAPVVDLVSIDCTSDIGHDFGPLQIGGTPETNRDEYRYRSPLSYLHNAWMPTLIIHGEADDRCPIGQGEQLFVALLEAGCEVEFARYPGASHAPVRTSPAAHRADVLERVSAWFQRHLGLSD